ncbi:hypothetical protein RBE51_20235 [Pseudomonas taiwanensis]|uniref:hypothetical protein n=1 Tax=Pseudomonas taiwanensis TaxID=470150 RepID=UPI0028DF4FE9|nr:hypothetical protein [Pseudomonas taiwanensis]MDT8925123.1 hypothetical protein [Pseudomonas taiwanensis]
MILNSQTYTQYSPYDSIELLWAGRDSLAKRRVELACDMATGKGEVIWHSAFLASSQWGSDVFESVHLLRPEIDSEAFHALFSHAVALGCLSNSQSCYLIFVCAIKSWGDLSTKYLKKPEPKGRIVARVLDQLVNHPKFRPIILDSLFLPFSSEDRSLKGERLNIDPAPLMNHFIDNPVLFDSVFKNLFGKRLAWALSHLPAKAIDGYFERHPKSDKLTTRLEIQLGL